MTISYLYAVKCAAMDAARRRRVGDAGAPRSHGTPDGIAKVVVFLVSDAAGYVSGVTIVVDGDMLVV